jgi:D-beta-D-heptose 7-phosphate kinase/D-beta-D-heptose 1-phosphate adenosyltransferase
MTPQEILNNAKGKRVLVIGDLILDEYIDGSSTRLSPEAPIPVVNVSGTKYVLGGAANVAANIVSLGGKATVLSSLSEDVECDILTKLMDKAGIDYFGPIVDKPTTVKTRVSSGGQQIVRYDQEDVTELSEEKLGSALKIISMMISEFDIIVLSDYNKGFFTEDFCDGIFNLACIASVEVISDFKPENSDYFIGSDYITPNWKEATEITHQQGMVFSKENLEDVARRLEMQWNNPVITLGDQGLYLYIASHKEGIHLKPDLKEVFDVSGAGDTVVAALALGIIVGASPLDLLTLCNKAAGIVVGKMGTSVVNYEEMG